MALFFEEEINKLKKTLQPAERQQMQAQDPRRNGQLDQNGSYHRTSTYQTSRRR